MASYLLVTASPTLVVSWMDCSTNATTSLFDSLSPSPREALLAIPAVLDLVSNQMDAPSHPHEAHSGDAVSQIPKQLL